MSDDKYYKRNNSFDAYTIARGDAVESEFDSIQTAFEKLPKKRTDDKKGFTEHFTVINPTESNHPATHAQVEAEREKNEAQDGRLDGVEATLKGIGDVAQRWTTLQYLVETDNDALSIPLQFQRLADVFVNGERKSVIDEYTYVAASRILTIPGIKAGDKVLVDVGLVPDTLLADLLAIQTDCAASKTAARDAETSAIREKEQTAQLKADTIVIKNEVTAKANAAAASESNAKDSEEAALDHLNLAKDHSDIAVNQANIAMERADYVRSVAERLLVNGGVFTPSASQEYPATLGLVEDHVWKISFPERSSSHTYTSGDLLDEKVSPLDEITWDSQTGKWSVIKTSSVPGILAIDMPQGKEGGSEVVITASKLNAKTVDELEADYERQDNAATTADIDAESTATKHVKLAQLWRAFANKVKSASTTVKGIVQLSNLYSGTSQTKATTEKALSDGLATKAAKSLFDSHTGNKSNPHMVTKAQVGLGNVPNYGPSDAYTTGGVNLATRNAVYNAYSALVALISAKAAQSSLDSHTGNKSNPHSVTKSQVGLGNVPNYGVSDVYTSTGTNIASRKAVYDAYITLSNAKLDKGATAEAVKITTSFSGKYPVVVNVNGQLYSNTGIQYEGSTNTLIVAHLNGNASSASNADKVDNLHASQFIRSDADDNVTGHTEWQDNKQVRLGSSADYRMYHDGSHTYQDNITGNVYFRQQKHGGSVYWQAENSSGSNKNVMVLVGGASPYMAFYYGGSKKFQITSYGSYTTGHSDTSGEVREQGVRVFSPNNIAAALAAIYPAGSPIPWPTSTVPTGFLECRGQAFDKIAYPELAKAYPTGILPDLRGEFIRGWDNGRGVDSGRVILSAQADEIRSHTHGVQGNLGSGTLGLVSDGGDIVQTEATGGDETRPRNISFMYIVRAS